MVQNYECLQLTGSAGGRMRDKNWFFSPKMVDTKHCCRGSCISDSRYPNKLPKQLKELARIRGESIFALPKASERP